MPAVTTRRGSAEPAPEPGAEPGSAPEPVVVLVPDGRNAAQGLTEEQAPDVIGQALARLQDTQPAWRKADLIRHLGELLPDDVACPDDMTAAAMLTGLADRVLAGGAGERVLMLEAPQWHPLHHAGAADHGRAPGEPGSATWRATGRA